MHRILQRTKEMNGWHKACAVFLAALLLLLAVRASDDYRWSDWGFGDAQTMLSLKQWEEGGWLHNYLLFKPQGYAKVIDALDDPELRHHAHGTCPGSSPRVGPRLWYTHYPAGYLVPYAVLFKLGLDSLFAVRMLSILFSIGALALMYLLFARITSPRVSFVAVLFYGLSSAFLGYADSLANQPIDDLLRFGFMYAVVMGTRASELHRNRWMIAAWVMEFALSLTSFDSVFFIFAWLIGWDLLEKRGFRWKVYFLFGMAPTTAHGLQFLQNVWYLGWQDAWIDIKDAFLLKHGTDEGYNFGQGRIAVILISLVTLFDNLASPYWFAAVVLIVYLTARKYLFAGDEESPSARLLGVLFLCGLAFVLILPHAARMPYEARQMMPFAGVLVSGFLWSAVKVFRESVHGPSTAQDTAVRPAPRTASIIYLLVSSGLLLALVLGFATQDRRPVYDISRIMPEVRFAEMLRTMPTRHEPVIFDMGGFWTFWDPKYVPGFPQIMPITEYYTGSKPVLCFNEPQGTATDVAALVRKSRERFSPVLISPDQGKMDRTIELLLKAGTISSRPTAVYYVMDRIVADLTDAIAWGAKP